MSGNAPDDDTAAMTAMLRRVADEADVAKVILRYAQGIDRRDFDQVRACFAPDARVEGTQHSGPVSDYLPKLLAGVETFPATMHFMGNQLREVDGDTARTETYAIAHHFADAAGTVESLVMGVRYLDELARTGDGRWVITHRRAVSDWVRTGPGREAAAPAAGGPDAG